MQSFILAIFPRKPYTLWLNGRYFLPLLERSFPYASSFIILQFRKQQRQNIKNALPPVKNKNPYYHQRTI